jgi:DNA gyrase subunit B
MVVPKNHKGETGGDDVRGGFPALTPYGSQSSVRMTTRPNLVIPKSNLVESICSEKLGGYLEQNPAVAKAILSKAVEAARARDAARRARDLSRKKAAFR